MTTQTLPQATADQVNFSLPWLPVLMYHRVVPRKEDAAPPHLYVLASEFEEQVRFLKQHGYTTVSLDSVVNGNARGGTAGGKQVVITFDDGYRDTFLYALPILQKYHSTATVFLVSSCLGGHSVWDCDKAETVPLMGLQELREMEKCGISFGSHSVSHRPLTSLDERDAWAEIAGSKEALEQEFAMEIPTFCFPYGRSNADLRDMVKRAGYIAACGTRTKEHTPLNISRIDASVCRGADLLWRWEVSGLAFRLRRNPTLRKLRAFFPSTRIHRLEEVWR